MNKYFLIFSLLFSFSSYAYKPRVSIITFLDEYSSIERIIENITKQSCLEDIELILVDTGIIDCTAANNYIQNNTVRLIHCHTSSPKSELLNGLISYCRGDFIMLLYSGDSLNPTLIEQYLKAFDANQKIDVVYGCYYVRYEDYAKFEEGPGWYWVNKPEFDPRLLYYNLPGQQCMWRKAMHKEYGPLDQNYHFFFFVEFWNRAHSRGATFKKLPITTGMCFLPYGTRKKLFNSEAQNRQGYEEIKNIYKDYHSNWQAKTPPCVENKPFVIITASYKNAEWYKLNLDSLLNQNYDNYRIIYIDDASPDNTGALVAEYVKECNQEHKITLIRNEERVGALTNIYTAVHMCDPKEIVLLVDGDDWLAHDNVLNRLNQIYQDPNIWATYGQFMWFPFIIEGFSHETDAHIIQDNSFRNAAWSVTHLRTFYAKLFQIIKRDDLMYDETRFYPMTWDLAIMYPIMEMCGAHSAFVADVLYIYNADNSINDNKINIELQGLCGQHILCKEPYRPLDSLLN